MENRNDEMKVWGESILEYRLPRWDELPTIDLYKDQVISLVEQYLSLFPMQEKPLTSAMINNYVKHGLAPAPTGKRYRRNHLAYFIAITVLKQILSVSEVHAGIQLQSRISGLHRAYNIFCDELENALRTVAAQTGACEPTAILDRQIDQQHLALRMACLSVATKAYTQKILSFPLPEDAETRQEKRRKKNK